MLLIGRAIAGFVASVTTTAGPPLTVRPVIRPMRWLLYAASGLVFLAGLQLSVFSEQTDTYFAWTISPPLTAAFLGASYWAAVPVEVLAAGQGAWAKARVAVPAIWLFTTLTLFATLLHFDRFHFSSLVASAQGAAWFWLAIYAGVPVAMLVIGLVQLRAAGGDPPRGPGPPRWLRYVVFAQGAGMIAIGASLFAAPTITLVLWPWALTPLTARAIGAWLLGIGVAAFHGVREDDLLRIRPLGGGYTVFAIFQFVALARYPGDVAWGAPAAWVYVAFLASVLPIGLYGWFGARGNEER